MHSDSTTDLSIIYSNLNNLNPNQENIVLLKTGALNPIHRSHISNMIRTKQYLENVYSFNVIGGYISPSNDHYVQGKLLDEFIPSKHRIDMCQKAIIEDNQQHWLSVDKAEAIAPSSVSILQVTSSLQDFLNEKIKLNKPISVIFVAGLDLFNCFNGLYRVRQSDIGGVVVVDRYGEDQSLIQSIMNENPTKLYFIPLDNNDQNQINDISSTSIRLKLRTNENCEHLTYKSVLEYLKMTPI